MAVRTITPGLRARPLLPFSSGFGGPKAHSEHYPFANELLRVCCSLIHSASHALRFWPFDVQILSACGPLNTIRFTMKIKPNLRFAISSWAGRCSSAIPIQARGPHPQHHRCKELERLTVEGVNRSACRGLKARIFGRRSTART